MKVICVTISLGQLWAKHRWARIPLIYKSRDKGGRLIRKISSKYPLIHDLKLAMMTDLDQKRVSKFQKENYSSWWLDGFMSFMRSYSLTNNGEFKCSFYEPHSTNRGNYKLGSSHSHFSFWQNEVKAEHFERPSKIQNVNHNATQCLA